MSYQHGVGTDIDKKKAFKLYNKKANLENIVAQYNLAFVYENGGVIVENIDQGDQNVRDRINELFSADNSVEESHHKHVRNESVVINICKSNCKHKMVTTDSSSSRPLNLRK